HHLAHDPLTLARPAGRLGNLRADAHDEIREEHGLFSQPRLRAETIHPLRKLDGGLLVAPVFGPSQRATGPLLNTGQPAPRARPLTSPNPLAHRDQLAARRKRARLDEHEPARLAILA